MDYQLYLQHTDVLTKLLFVALVLMSIMVWVTLALRLWRTRQLMGQSASGLRQHLMAQGLTKSHPQAWVEQALLQHLGRIRLHAEQGLSVLGTIATIAPFVGLFGTVWGIFHALHAIGVSGQSGLAQVAGPVGESLIMTGLGLAVAIPAVLGYNICVRQNRRLMAQLQDQAHGVLMQEIAGERVVNPALTPESPNHAAVLGSVV